MKTSSACLISLLSLAVAACGGPKLAAPTGRGDCYRVQNTDGEWRFDKIASGQKDLEHCAAELEKVRLGLGRVGLSLDEINGSYQGRYLFLTPKGIFTSNELNGNRYLLMIRYQGKLVAPGAVSQ